MGGAVALLLHKKDPRFWNGAVLVAPMCKVTLKANSTCTYTYIYIYVLIYVANHFNVDIRESEAAPSSGEYIDKSGRDHTQMEDCPHKGRH